MKYFFTFCIITFLAGFSFGQDKTDSLKVPFNCSCKMYKLYEEEVYTIVEKMPEYPGGAARMMKYVKDATANCMYSEQDPPPSSMYFNFVIDTAGNVTNVCVSKYRHLGYLTECEKSILDELSKMEKFAPAEQNGKKVSVQYNLPIRIHYR